MTEGQLELSYFVGASLIGFVAAVAFIIFIQRVAHPWLKRYEESKPLPDKKHE